MARVWTCQGCGTRLPRVRQKCDCGRSRPKARVPKHRAILEQRPYQWWVDGFGEVCGICGNPPKEGRKLHRDHDHRTGEPRGLLCFRCNAALRSYMTVDWLRRALAYLSRTA